MIRTYDLIRLVPICFLLVLSGCSMLPEIIPFNSPQGTSQPTQTPQSTAHITPSPTVEVKLAEFNINQEQTPGHDAGLLQPEQATATPTITPPLQSTSDLLFLSDGKLMRWDHITNFTSPLVDSVREFSASKDASRIALLRDTQVTANGVALFNLDLLDMETKQIISLAKGITGVTRIVLSPNGLWIAVQEQQDGRSIISGLNILQPDQIKELGVCHQSDNQFCDEIAWSPDSFALLWQDSQGFWLSKRSKNQPELLTGQTFEVTDPKGETSLVAVTFKDVRWSPDGRYVSAQVTTEAKVCWFAVLDTYQGRWTEVPGTFNSECPTSASINWTEDGKLLVANISQQANDLKIIVNQWQLIPTRTGLFASDSEMEFGNIQSALTGLSLTGETRLISLWPEKILNRFIGLGIGQADKKAGMALFLIDQEQEQLEMIIQRPGRADQVFWAPDGSGALLQEANGKVIFVPLQGDDLIDLPEANEYLGGYFVWTPARLRE